MTMEIRRPEALMTGYRAPMDRQDRLLLMQELCSKVDAECAALAASDVFMSNSRLNAALTAKGSEVIRDWLDNALATNRYLSMYSKVLYAITINVEFGKVNRNRVDIRLGDAVRRFVEGETT